MTDPSSLWRCDSEPEQNREAAQFRTTHWSVVLAAGRSTTPDAGAALEQLCRAYWYPLYAYVRWRGYSPEDAQDLAQEFFHRLLQKERLALADPARGRFRTFLLSSLGNFLTNEWIKVIAGKARRRPGPASAAVRKSGAALRCPTGRCAHAGNPFSGSAGLQL